MKMGNLAEPPTTLTRDLTESDHDRMKDNVHDSQNLFTARIRAL